LDVEMGRGAGLSILLDVHPGRVKMMRIKEGKRAHQLSQMSRQAVGSKAGGEAGSKSLEMQLGEWRDEGERVIRI
jgi:hypothetical protein